MTMQNQVECLPHVYRHIIIIIIIIISSYFYAPVPVVARSKALVYGRSPAAIVGSKKKSYLRHAFLSVVCVVCCQVEVSTTNRSLLQRSPTYCGRRCVSSRNLVIRGSHSLRWAAKPEEINNTFMQGIYSYIPETKPCV
jgi:hypothetical protein